MTSPSSDSDDRIRSCRPEEIPEVLSLWQESRGGLGKTDDQPSLTRLLDRDEDSLLVAVREGRIVGTLIATWDGWRGNMYRLTVHPAWQRKGIALQLIKAAETALRSRGARRVSALVWEEDQRAVAVWLRADFAHDAGTGRFVKTLVQ